MTQPSEPGDPRLALAAGIGCTPARALSFAFICSGAAVFAFGAWRRARRLPAPVRAVVAA